MNTLVTADGAASGFSVSINWGALGLVFVVGLVATVLIVGFYALGTRLLAVGAPDLVVADGVDPESGTVIAQPRVLPRPVSATVGAVLCYGVCVAAVLYGLYLVIPIFHH